MGHSSMTTVITPFAGHVYVYVNSSARTAHMTEQAYKASRSRLLATSQETAMPCHHSSQHASATQTALAADLSPTNPAHARPAACSCCPRCDGHLPPAPLERCATHVAALIPLLLAALEADGHPSQRGQQWFYKSGDPLRGCYEDEDEGPRSRSSSSSSSSSNRSSCRRRRRSSRSRSSSESSKS